jgi:molecular chaperone GrpE
MSTDNSETAETKVPSPEPAVAGAGGGAEGAGALAQAEATAQEHWNRYLRTAAELENVRKRAARDVEQARRFGVERLAAELLSVLDSLEMGLGAAGTATVESLIEGKRATLRLLAGALQKFGVEEIAPVNEPFDPQLHEAISVQAAPGVPAGGIVAVVQKGYQLNGRLLRPARVVVAASTPPEAGEPGQPTGAEDDAGDA